MRKLSYQFGTKYETTPDPDPWRRRMPTQIYIGRETPKRASAPIQPGVFGQRRHQPETVMTARRFSLARLASLFQGPKKTRRTKLR